MIQYSTLDSQADTNYYRHDGRSGLTHCWACNECLPQLVLQSRVVLRRLSLISVTVQFFFLSFQFVQNFQVVISTDGNASFAALIYDDPQGIANLVGISTPQALSIGFDPGEDDYPPADFSGAMREGRLSLEPVNIFRIDGWLLREYNITG